MNEYDIEKTFKAIEDELMASMIRNMKSHRVEEIDEKKEWAMWQAEQLKALEKYKRQNRKRFKSQFSDINKSIDSIISAARIEGNMRQEITILNAIKKGYVDKKALKSSAQTTGEFFRLNDRKMNALIRATQDDLKKAEQAVLRMVNDQYRKIIFNAQVYANSGAGTYEQAVDMATKDFLKRGINCIEYANGARHTISDYASMAIRTASKRAYLTGEGEKRKEWGITTVIINKRGNACPKCLPFVGKVLIDDVWSGGKQSDGPYLLMSNAMTRGLYHPRCRDSHTTYFEGINTPGASYTKEELKQIENAYRKEQKEQYAKRQQEKYERLEKFSLDNGNQKLYGRRAKIWRHARYRTGDLESRGFVADRNAIQVKNFDDVTEEFLKKAKSNSYDVVELEEYISEGLVYRVDGINVMQNNSKRELEVAELLKSIFEERIELVPEVRGKFKGIKTPDYLIGGERWDLKELSGVSKDAVRNAISKCKEQAEHFILDITKSKLNISEISKQAENVFRAANTKFVRTLIIVEDEKIIRILKRK